MLKIGKLAVRVIRPGEGWGINQETTCSYPLIEFYDPRITGRDSRGHVVARIAAKVVFSPAATYGLPLDERVPAWCLTPSQVQDVRYYCEAMGV